MPRISIILPVFNMEKLLPRCLDSLLSQTLQDIEVVTVDDCSTDGSVGVLEAYNSNDQRVKIVRHPENRGTMWARESGIESATGDYFLFVDPDDAIRPEACSALLEKASREEADLVVFDYEKVFPDGSTEILRQRLPYGSSAHGIIMAMLRGDAQYALSAKLFRKDLMDKYSHLHIKGYNRSQDVAAMCIISPHIKKGVSVESPFYVYYQNSGSATRKRMSNKALENIIWTNTYRMESVRGDEELQKEAERYCARVFFNMVKNGYDRNVVRSLAKENGLWGVVSLKTLYGNMGLRKAVPYWLVTHVGGTAPLLYPRKNS